MQLLKKHFLLSPLAGQEMLYWKAKRKIEQVDYIKRTVRERYGIKTENELHNQLFYGDNFDVLRHLIEDYRGKVKLIYIDPPFESQALYQKKIKLKGPRKSQEVLYETQYNDCWTDEGYLQFMYERLILLREILAEDGSIYVHCDWHKVHHLRLMMDEIFGAEQFRNEIIWKRGTVKGAKARGKQFARNHDSILYYSKGEKFTFNRQHIPFDAGYLKRFKKDDGDGMGPYRDDQAIGTRSAKAIEEMKRTGRVFELNGKLRIKTYLKDLPGVVIDDNWTDIADVNVMSKARTLYPTQKPEALLERIIKTSSNEGDLILDCFMGSGTACTVAAQFGRQFIGSDMNLGAVQTTISRLTPDAVAFEISTVAQEWDKQAGHITIDVNEAGTHLVIERFLPPELTEKLQAAEITVEDWRELVDCVKIDWNYDGTVFKPTVVDCSVRGDFVMGSYRMPKDCQGATICLQVTDLLSHLHEMRIELN